MILLHVSFYFSTYLEDQKKFLISENGKLNLRSSKTNDVKRSKLKHDIFCPKVTIEKGYGRKCHRYICIYEDTTSSIRMLHYACILLMVSNSIILIDAL